MQITEQYLLGTGNTQFLRSIKLNPVLLGSDFGKDGSRLDLATVFQFAIPVKRDTCDV